MARHKLTDGQWELIEHLLPKRAKTGRPPADRRKTLDGIPWILRTGVPWRDLPKEFGNWSTVSDWFDISNGDGTLDAIRKELQASHGNAGVLDAVPWCVDGTVIRAARCAAGGGKKTTQTSLATTL